MYKDVWKKFGTKILIVICSVLLLGGVAVAVPKLQAAELNNITVRDLNAWVTSGASVEFKTADNKDPVYTIENGTEKVISPGRIKITYGGDSVTLIESQGDYTVLNKQILTQAGEYTISIEGSQTGGKLRGPGSVTFSGDQNKYKIAKAELSENDINYSVKSSNNPYTYSNKGADVIVENSTDSITSSVMDITLNIAGQSMSLESADYEILDQTANKSLGARDVKVRIPKNFRPSGQNESADPVWSLSDVKAFKDITKQIIEIDGRQNGAGLTSVDNSTSVEIRDKDTDAQITSFSKKINERVQGGMQQTQMEITGNRSGEYVGVWQSQWFSESTPRVEYRFEDDKYYDSAVEYKDTGTASYRIEPVLRLYENGTEQSERLEYSSGYTAEYTVVKREMDESGQMVENPAGENATAGTVRMDITVTAGTSVHRGETYSLYYRVRRNIADAIFGDGTPQTLNDKFIYNGQPHYMTPTVYFNDNERHELVFAEDYRIEGYSLDKRYGDTYNGGVIDTQPQSVTDAGRVYMSVKGTLDENDLYNGGYYGTLISRNSAKQEKGRYLIEPQDIAELDCELALEGRKDYVPEYPLTGSKPQINAEVISSVDGVTVELGKEGTEHEVHFYSDEACTQEIFDEDWKDLGSGTYYVRYEFVGNYDGSLTGEFKIHAYTSNEIRISFAEGGCSDECSSEDPDKLHHVYHGGEHEPELIVKTNISGETPRILTKDIDYTVGYTKNINAGTATATVVLKGSGQTRSADFTINQRSIDNVTDTGIKLNTPATAGGEYYPGELANGSMGVLHEFSGKKSMPNLESVQYEKGDASLILWEKIADAGQGDPDSDYEVKAICKWNDQGVWTDINLRTASLTVGEDYCLKIQGKGNYRDIGYTDSFQLAKRDISKTTINDVLPMENGDAQTELTNGNDSILAYVQKQLRIQDFGETLVLGNRTSGDYEIEIEATQDFRKKNGTVEFTIYGRGCYTGSVKKTVSIGRHIQYASVREVGATSDLNFTNGELTLNNYYTQNGSATGDDPYGFNFDKHADTTKDGVRLYYTINGSRMPITFGEPDTQGDSNANYKVVEWSEVIRDTVNPNGDSYATVTIQGMNGYYGTAKMKFWVRRTSLQSEYEIEIVDADKQFYTGDWIEPEVRVWRKGADHDKDQPLSESCYTKKFFRNKEVSGGSQAEQGTYWAYVEIVGQYGYEGTLRAYFEIKRRPISRPVDDPAQDPDKDNTTAAGFELRGFEGTLKYRPTTKTLMGEYAGAWQDVALWFNPDSSKPGTQYKQLTIGTDYTFECKNAEVAGIKTASITVQGINNFTGEFTWKYTISRASLKSDCTVKIVPGDEWLPFTGEIVKPRITVEQTVKSTISDDTNTYPLEEGKDYKVEYVNSYFVNDGSNLSDSAATYLYVVPTTTTGGALGNYVDNSDRQPYKIYGNLKPSQDSKAARNSRLVVNDNAPMIIPYGESIASKLRLALEQKLEGTSSYEDRDTSSKYNLKNGDFTVSCPNETIGKARYATIIGTGNSSNQGAIVGENRISITIQGNLSTVDQKPEVLWAKNGGTNEVGFKSGFSDSDLQKLLTIRCGGRDLEWNKDYRFVGDIRSEIGGPYTIQIEPTEEANKNDAASEPDTGYLIGSLSIQYYVKEDIGDGGTVEGITEGQEFVYAHGLKVLDLDTYDFGIKTGDGKKLENGTDYKVTATKEGANCDLIECGDYRLVIRGSTNYSGTIIRNVKVVPYDLGADYAQGKVTVTLESDRITFTGSTVFPVINEVVVKNENNSRFSLKPISEEESGGDYGIRAGSQDGRNINWTDIESGDTPPEVIIYGTGNYAGEIAKPYYITQKDIGDSDIDIAPIEGQFYQNGKEIKPYPEITYKEKISETEDRVRMSLSGIEYVAANSNQYEKWKEYGTHFTYQYLKDVTTTGDDKEILIRGIGNFTGTRKVSYVVAPLNLSRTKLVFNSEESPVYDGEEQKPAFQLVYEDIVILTFMDGKVSSNYLSPANVRCDFENNKDASTDDKKARITVSMVDNTDNYEGSISAEFVILPAPLENHTRFMYRPVGSNADVDLSSYRLNLDFKGVGTTVRPGYAFDGAELQEGQVGIYYNYPEKANNGAFLIPGGDYYNDPNGEDGFRIEYKYVEPDTEDVDAREEYQDPDTSYAGKVRVTITGRGNYIGKASYWYFIGKDISADAKISISPTTSIYNSQSQAPKVTITGVDKDTCTIAEYRNEVAIENLIRDRSRDFINAGTYYIRVEGNPRKGTYATKPETLTFTITPRAFSNNLIIDGFKREYSYTGYDICPVGISVTDYIDNTKYRLTEDVDYTLTYTNNLNAGTAYINVEGKNNFSGKATANFMITSSTISSGGTWGSNSFLDQGTGEISGATAVAPGNVSLSMDTVDAMYYTGSPVYPKVSIAGMTENIDYTVTFANNVDVGTAVATITGIGNNNGTITKNFRIIAQLSKCTISPIPAQQYTGSEVKPALTVKCGSNILMEGVDYAATYSNNINIGTATVTLRALNNANYTGTTSTTFSIGNDVGGFIISGYAPSYAYTGKAITPGVVVETGSRTLVQGTDYTVSYANNVNAGTATITVTGIGRYSGTQTVNFVIEPKSMQSLDTSDIADRTYTGDAYTPDITVSDGSKVLTKGVDYTVTYTNNTEPGMASVVIKGVGSNYSGTKVVSFKISAVAVKGLKASNVKYNSLKLKWTKQDYADGYQICNSSSKVLKTVTKNSATITGLSAGKTYKYKVRSYIKNADGTRSYGAFSSVLNATTKLKTPTVKVVSKAKGQARISWSKVSGASGYEIYYKKSAGAKYKKLKTVNNANIRVCTVRGMKSGDRAYFRIRAFRNNGSKKVYSSLNPLKVITVK